MLPGRISLYFAEYWVRTNHPPTISRIAVIDSPKLRAYINTQRTKIPKTVFRTLNPIGTEVLQTNKAKERVRSEMKQG